MSLLNPFAGLRNLNKVPAFLRELRADLRALRAKDLPWTVQVPARNRFQDDAQHAAAVAALIREQKFAVVRQQVHKAHIRATLWHRFGICYMLLGPLSFGLSIAIVIMHVVCFMEAPWLAQALLQVLDPHALLNRILP